MEIVNRFLPAGEFDEYLNKLALTPWKPDKIIVHNTASPTLAQRPSGFTSVHMENLKDYYEGLGWSSGPHCFVDDNGVWLFSSLSYRGTHSPSWNRTAWGVELLGDYSTDDATTGRGAKVVENGARVVAAMLTRLGLKPNNATVKFHKEDPNTTHKDCPGKTLKKEAFLALVAAHMVPQTLPGWTILTDEGETLKKGVQSGEWGTGLVRLVAEHLGATLDVDSEKKEIVLRKMDT